MSVAWLLLEPRRTRREPPLDPFHRSWRPSRWLLARAGLNHPGSNPAHRPGSVRADLRAGAELAGLAGGAFSPWGGAALDTSETQRSALSKAVLAIFVARSWAFWAPSAISCQPRAVECSQR